MTTARTPAPEAYDRAAPLWGDKMRTLGYFDGYLGFLSDPSLAAPAGRQVIDVGCGTAALSEAWAAVHGAPDRLVLLDPSKGMLERAQSALTQRGITPEVLCGHLGDPAGGPYDEVLAAHVIEHCGDPGRALRQMYDLLRPGGTLRLVVSKPHWCNVIIWLQWRHRTFGEAEIAALLMEAGFEEIAVYAFPSGPPSRTSRGLVARRPG